MAFQCTGLLTLDLLIHCLSSVFNCPGHSGSSSSYPGCLSISHMGWCQRWEQNLITETIQGNKCCDIFTVAAWIFIFNSQPPCMHEWEWEGGRCFMQMQDKKVWDPNVELLTHQNHLSSQALPPRVSWAFQLQTGSLRPSCHWDG